MIPIDSHCRFAVLSLSIVVASCASMEEAPSADSYEGEERSRDDAQADPRSRARPSIAESPADAPNGRPGDVFDLGSADTVFYGEDYGIAGSSVLIPGDLDGDGFDDIVIGDRDGSRGTRDQSGQIHIIYGRATLNPDWDLRRTVTLGGHLRGEQVGEWLASAGDVDGDGFPDFLVSAGGIRLFGAGGSEHYDEGVDRGGAYLVYGGPERLSSGFLRDVAVRFEGVIPSGQMGQMVSGLGDNDGDGHDDFVVGSFGDGPGTGQVHVFYGSATRFAPTVSVAEADAVITSPDAIGWPTAIGDQDGDGDGEFLIRAETFPDRGGLLLVEGNKTRMSGELVAGELAVARFVGTMGSVAAALGDIDQDGVTDFTSGHTRERTPIFFGGQSFTADVPPDSAPGQLALGLFGWAGGGADFDGDGCPDFYSSDTDFGGGRGAVHIFSGQCRRLSGTLDAADSVTWVGREYGYERTRVQDAAGQAALSAGDVNGDGVGDLLVGATGNHIGDVGGGHVYLILGR